jgi:L-ascorbate metabolism protein UlaG (beta-lactamase superfamily)
MAQVQELAPAGGGAAPDLTTGSVSFIGTATVLIRYGGFTILTDPNFLHKGEKVRLGYGLRSTRRTNPAMEISQLPPLDFVVLSHMHEDHFDRVAERQLDKTVPIVTTPHAASALGHMGFIAPQALTTWDSITFHKGGAEVCVTAMPGRHGPGPLTYALPPVMGSMLEFGAAGAAPRFRLYISGDTLLHDQLAAIPRRYPQIDLALLHLGGTKVLGILLTMDARQGVAALRLIGPRLAIPIHYNDYTVFKSPLRDFVAAVRAAGLAQKVRLLKHGDTYEFTVPAASG